jgi:ADP-ribose pyrophosphatase YjhB (NUDIX family)
MQFSAMTHFVRQVPDGDTRERAVCAACGHIDYQNPKIVVGSVVVHHGRVLLCRRAIEPRRGFWTLPAGYMELGETAEEGAKREALEEAEADIALDGLLAVYSISRIGQVQLIYRARFAEVGAPHFAAGPESLDVRLFGWNDIPRHDIAFPSVHWALAAWREGADRPLGAPSVNPLVDPRGAVPLGVAVEAGGL